MRTQPIRQLCYTKTTSRIILKSCTKQRLRLRKQDIVPDRNQPISEKMTIHMILISLTEYVLMKVFANVRRSKVNQDISRSDPIRTWLHRKLVRMVSVFETRTESYGLCPTEKLFFLIVFLPFKW